MLVTINDIKVRKRVRKDLGNIEPLMDSLKRYGLLNPITLNSRYELVAGQRRLEAAKRLGWTSINAVIVDVTDKVSLLEIELEENTQRVEFTDSELLEGYAALEKMKNPNFFSRMWYAVTSFFSEVFASRSEARLNSKIVKTRNFLFLLPLGIVLLIISAVLYNTGTAGQMLRNIFDVSSALLMLGGIAALVRIILLRRQSS
ncbi:MAG TPA: ParB N-terminal domain-containing protein [Treponemataceae bacterium]|nr:ParB N-terminal domain-containing protein [Treponemataceae bacterium]HQL05541.1 ParB N-terminal domain-containing protein [Treponemataceae bacterium]